MARQDRTSNVDIRVEFKPLLSSANIIIVFSKDLINLSSRVVVNSNTVTVEADSLNIIFPFEHLSLKPNSCRGLRWIGPQELQLTLEAEWTTSVNGGGDADSHQYEDQRQHINQDHIVSRIKSCQSKCYCVGCGAQIFKPTCVFKRVLPLPSENWSDFADIWFCHNHNGGGEGQCHSHGPTEPVDPVQRELRPRSEDCLVSGLYLLVNSDHVRPCAVNAVADKLICRRCSNFLGFVKRSLLGPTVNGPQFESDVYKIYLHAITFRPEKNKQLIPKPLIPESLSNGQEGSILSEQTVQSFLCHLLRDQSHRFTSFRFIVESNQQLGNVAVLLWLLDQDLVVFSTSLSPKKSSCSQKSPPSNSCSYSRSMKVLYKADFSHTANGGVDSQLPDVFTSWRKDNTVHSLSLPYPLCKQLLSLLISSTHQLPKPQRYLNGFHVGYLSAS